MPLHMASTSAATEQGAPHPPPIGPQGGTAWVNRLEPLIGKEGWFQVEGEYAKSTVSQLNKAAAGARGAYRYRLPPGKWEFTGRRAQGQPEGRVVIWAHYVGPEEDTAA